MAEGAEVIQISLTHSHMIMGGTIISSKTVKFLRQKPKSLVIKTQKLTNNTLQRNYTADKQKYLNNA